MGKCKDNFVLDMIEKFDFTDGEWKLDDYGEIMSGETELCSMRYDNCGDMTMFDNYKANARLISSAPEMLNALIMVVNEYDEDNPPSTVGCATCNPPNECMCIRNIAIPIIEKATGKTWSEIND